MNTKTVAESVYSQQSAFINGKNELGDMEDDKDDQSVQDMDNDTMSVITQSVFNNEESHVSLHYGVRDRHPSRLTGTFPTIVIPLVICELFVGKVFRETDKRT